jgi:acetyltransferase
VGGVHLDLRDDAAVRRAWGEIRASVERHRGPGHFVGVTLQPMIRGDAYEVLLGSSVDPQFGPVLVFGLGGRMVEVVRDRALALPPLNATLARRWMEQTRVDAALRGQRGRGPVNLVEVERIALRLSHLVMEQRWIQELDINPLWVSTGRVVALDARIVLHPPSTHPEAIPSPAIRPYPSHYVSPWQERSDGLQRFRPIRPEDEPLVVAFHQSLGERSVYQRYFSPMRLDQRVAHERLIRTCHADYDREMVLVAELAAVRGGPTRIAGIGRLSRRYHGREAEFALLVSDADQHRGLGTELLRRLVAIGRAEGLGRITGLILADNREMLHVAEKAGFALEHPAGGGEVTARLNL